ncbi:hypothetical protein GCM10011386_22500 [Parapedobacter defluvii]|uniref:CPBP family intramembrane metalloprotease n=1 Tax=Parapedobacter defluvii TaxID=2045106 RepID=A0ABQ1LX34_9SPHI|nr:hypothetical protein [Parapedobacter defluvii]GGC29993.1 hypothetical protein GCM10011386_22500 [Parapedobacter defluvii]
MRDFIKKYEIWLFLTLAPLVNVVVSYAYSKGIISIDVYRLGRFYALMLLLVCVVMFTKGTEGIKDLFRPMSAWKVHPKWYLFSLLFPFVICAITLLIKSVYQGIEYASLLKFNFPPLGSSLFILNMAFMGEVVWVSYAIRELSKTIKPFYASQIIGLFWTGWWLPSVILNAGVIPNLPIWSLAFNMLGASGMCAVVYGKTKSGICVCILQFMLNLSLVTLPVSPSLGGILTYSVFGVIYFVVMLGFMYLMNPAKNFKTVKGTL